MKTTNLSLLLVPFLALIFSLNSCKKTEIDNEGPDFIHYEKCFLEYYVNAHNFSQIVYNTKNGITSFTPESNQNDFEYNNVIYDNQEASIEILCNNYFDAAYAIKSHIIIDFDTIAYVDTILYDPEPPYDYYLKLK